ncbi:MAG: T9SS type A sorting domain-containing protein, partial [Calditrichaeota bacterium]|nr:T9SS type A sorting domain-containing protein [Calditrichota bacterium]
FSPRATAIEPISQIHLGMTLGNDRLIVGTGSAGLLVYDFEPTRSTWQWDLPTAFSLHQNQPNPFNPDTTIPYTLHTSQHVTLRMYDLGGRLVQSWTPGLQEAGHHQLVLDGRGLASGIYFYELRSEYGSTVRKMILLK